MEATHPVPTVLARFWELYSISWWRASCPMDSISAPFLISSLLSPQRVLESACRGREEEGWAAGVSASQD